MNVWKELALSVVSPRSYEKFLKDRKAKVFLFGFLLLVFYFIIIIVVPLMKLQLVNGGLPGLLNRYVPDFTLTDGRLWVEKEINYDSDGICVMINTSSDYQLYDADQIAPLLRGYSTVLAADSEKVIVKSGGRVEQFYFDEFPAASFSRMDLMMFAPYVYLFAVAFMMAAFLIMGLGFFLGALIVALIGLIVASCMKCQLTFGQLYNLSLHARTPSLLLKAILSFLPFTVPFFLFLNFGISVCYLAGAISKMKEKKLMEPLAFTTYDPEDGGDWNNFR